MTRQTLVVVAAVVSLTTAFLAGAQTQPMSFFITSAGSGDGANLGGLAGADKRCQTLAEAAGSRGRVWRAYLSTTGSGSEKPVNAKDRIGAGPWYNAKGVRVAENVADLHSDNNKLSKENSLNEKGGVVNGRGDNPNMHDILTGTQADGTVAPGPDDSTCKNWTSNSDGAAMLGHHDRQGISGPTATSWNAAHPSRGCSQENLRGTGGAGLFYCFAAK